jgi:hypothetical protein
MSARWGISRKKAYKRQGFFVDVLQPQPALELEVALDGACGHLVGTRVSPSDIPGVAKALLGLSLAFALLGYILAGAGRGRREIASVSV